MIHIMSPVKSTRSPNTIYTAQGLGDRVHLITIAWCLSNQYKQSVTLHLHKLQSIERKKKSFLEILELFPQGNIQLKFHDLEPTSDFEFEDFIRDSGVNVCRIFYGDFPGWNEDLNGIDVSPLLGSVPILNLTTKKIDRKYVTSQWDTTGAKRRFRVDEVERIISHYESEGFEVITVGGQAQEEIYRNSLRDIAKLISEAEFHIGVDSGFMHFAQLFLPPSKIHVYSKSNNFWSHHLFRGLKNGMKLNVHYKKISRLSLFLIRIRYTSPNVTRYLHKFRSKIGLS